MASQLRRLLHVQVSDSSGTGSGGFNVVTGVDCSVDGDQRFIDAYVIAQSNVTATTVCAQIVRCHVVCGAPGTIAIVGQNSATRLGTAPGTGFTFIISGTTATVRMTNDAAADTKMQVVFYVYG